MAEIRNKYSTRSKTTDVPGRTLNSARTNHWIIDSPSGPGEAVSTGESFMAGIAACGVSLVEHHARRNNMPFGTLTVDIEGARTDESWPDFAWINVHFTYTGIDDDQAASLTRVWKENCPLYRAVAKATKTTVTHEVKELVGAAG